ncbi:hypothetical protein N799_05190 [Lysobacter arseniciresistens ZS79]|uniref:Uncharacterized protein n=1 Tax=Lysobacter arseniciresistens ZS79 TaxID=913325 RepID=A0A0A0F3T0_9GAMM|nr:hypothetical protein [Lysobacter arseniciresistens]KGM57469.1 hypothetical protein N799_05190 [Lysobacter arseniciresistens ZS79]
MTALSVFASLVALLIGIVVNAVLFWFGFFLLVAAHENPKGPWLQRMQGLVAILAGAVVLLLGAVPLITMIYMGAS